MERLLRHCQPMYINFREWEMNENTSRKHAHTVVISHWQSQSPLTQGWRYRAARDKILTSCCFNASERLHRTCYLLMAHALYSTPMRPFANFSSPSGVQLSSLSSAACEKNIGADFSFQRTNSLPPLLSPLFSWSLLLSSPLLSRSRPPKYS